MSILRLFLSDVWLRISVEDSTEAKRDLSSSLSLIRLKFLLGCLVSVSSSADSSSCSVASSRMKVSYSSSTSNLVVYINIIRSCIVIIFNEPLR
jgi:hypothetical protein